LNRKNRGWSTIAQILIQLLWSLKAQGHSSFQNARLLVRIEPKILQLNQAMASVAVLPLLYQLGQIANS